MASHPQAQAMFGAIESHAQAAGGTLGLGSFLRVVIDTLKSRAHASIDTEEERDAIVDAVMKAADTFVAPKFPIAWAQVRTGIRTILDDAIDHLPSLV